MTKLARVVFSQMKTAHVYKMRIASLEQERDEKLGEMKLVQNELVSKIFAFAKERKDEIVRSGKSVTLATGQVGWREAKPAVEIAAGFTEKGIIAALMKRNKKYLRFTAKLNKEKMLQDFHDGTFRRTPGIEIRQGEEGFISLAPRGKEKPETITVVAE